MKVSMLVCPCCYDPVVYPKDLGLEGIPIQIIVQGDIATFEAEQSDHSHRFSTTRISHEVLEKCGMEYRDVSFPERKPRRSWKTWHLPDGRPLTPGGLYGGVNRILVENDTVAVFPLV